MSASADRTSGSSSTSSTRRWVGDAGGVGEEPRARGCAVGRAHVADEGDARAENTGPAFGGGVQSRPAWLRLEQGGDVVVVGSLTEGGSIEASQIMVKCPSKYEEQYGSNSTGGTSK